jgi:cysteine synthase A
MIEQAERSGQLPPGGVVVEPTSGNTGIGLALVCAVRGYRCILAIPESASLERRQLLEAFGAEVVRSPEEEQLPGAVAKAREIAGRTAGAFLPQQFDNDPNPRMHAATTAREILHAMRGLSIDAFVAGVGTGGTITGVGEVLRREASPRPRVVAVKPESCATLSRSERGPSKIQGLAVGFVPKNYHPQVVDEIRTVTDADAWKMKTELARREGLLVGISAGTAVQVALEVAAELGPGKNVVILLPDSGERYFSLAETRIPRSPARVLLVGLGRFRCSVEVVLPRAGVVALGHCDDDAVARSVSSSDPLHRSRPGGNRRSTRVLGRSGPTTSRALPKLQLTGAPDLASSRQRSVLRERVRSSTSTTPKTAPAQLIPGTVLPGKPAPSPLGRDSPVRMNAAVIYHFHQTRRAP